MNTAVIDLFCGVGGLTYGLKEAGLNVVAGIDNDPSCEYAYVENNRSNFICADISRYSSEEINSLYGNVETKILVGCAPCQTFSKQTKKYKNRIYDKKWKLLTFFSQHIENIQPAVVSMENVPQLRKYGIFKNFVRKLKELKYNVSYSVVDCSKYGMPQNRKRLVLLASKFGDIAIVPPAEKVKKRTVRDVIGNLPAINSGETNEKDPLHRSAQLSDKNLLRIRQSIQGGTWRDWDKELILDCHKKGSGQTYSSVYGRMKWDKPSSTITTQFYSLGTGRFGHPEQDRALSLREGALLQTFPKEYKFFENTDTMTIRTISRHIGNAVPVDLGKIIGLSIKKHLESYNIKQEEMI
ncbi:MAG: DNA cytosine methyltransferase [Endomicrobium sp.]|jgi:DNA (cytosine-5)-methyltransferase 1|nr:DNA cytosine methyltransferase [Endomicrobium sp.]